MSDHTTSEWTEAEKNWLWIIGLIVGVIFFAPGLLIGFFAPVRAWLLEINVLTTTNVVIPIGEGAGLDPIRILIAIAGIALIVLLTVLGIRQHLRDKKLAKAKAQVLR